MRDPGIDAYRDQMERWLPGFSLTLEVGGQRLADAVLRWRGPAGAVVYIVEAKRHLANLDAAAVAHQLRMLLDQFRKAYKGARGLVLAPYVRPQQADVLQRADVDFIDQAGNARLNAPGLHVYVQGQRPPKVETRRLPITKAWARVTLALLLRPELVRAPYRDVARAADVALGTVPKCLLDLRARGFLEGTGERRVLANRRELIAQWIQAYVEHLRPALVEHRLHMKAADRAARLQALGRVLRKHDIPWCLTGTDAAERLTHHYRTDETEIYAAPARLEEAAVLRELPAQPTDQGGNLRVIEIPIPAVQAAVHAARGVRLAPELLIYAELRYRGTTQALEAAEMLLPAVLADAGN